MLQSFSLRATDCVFVLNSVQSCCTQASVNMAVYHATATHGPGRYAQWQTVHLAARTRNYSGNAQEGGVI